MLAGPPREPVAVAPVVSALAAGGAVRAVWVNEVGGTTFEIRAASGRRFVKWAPAGSGIDLAAEAERLAWAGPFTPVPRFLGHGVEADGAWLMTEALDGTSAVAETWRRDPDRAVAAVGAGLAAFHDRLDPARCPFTGSASMRVDDARRRAAAGALDPARWHPEHRSLSVEGALAALALIPDVDRLVVGHGDACAPNTLLRADGSWAGHVDLGALGTADRWADLAVATWSTVWNYGPGFERALLDAYGVDPDPERTAYYRLAWDLGP